MTNPSADPFVGRMVAHYEILARLGGGGMGVVYRARDTRLGRIVALKFLPPQWSGDDAAKQRFVREAQAASATDHRNICTIHDIGTADDGQLFIVMAYYEGPTLKQRLDAGALPIDEALEVATQLADGLARAHAQGVVHRDIKPGNLMLAEDGVRIVDFGLATFADALQLTVAGSTLGTAAYMSPEQVRGEAVDARADVWAAGVVLYQMLAGHVPFRGAYAEAIAYAIRHDAPAPLREARPEIPEDVEQLVFRALHKDPAIRFQSGRELARALRQVRGQTMPVDLRTEVIQTPLPRPARVTPRRRRALVIAAAVLAMTAAPMGWWLVPDGGRTPIVVAPVANRSGDPELDRFRLALTQTMIAGLAESRDVRPIAYDRLVQSVRGLLLAGSDVAARDILEAASSGSGARLVAVPALLFENGLWRAQVELRNVETGTREDVYETAPVESALPKETAHALMTAAAAGLRDRLTSRRSRLLDAVGRLTGGGAAAAAGAAATIEAAAAFEQGIRAFTSMEYAAALDAFTTAAQRDPRHALSAAWRARVAAIMGRRETALEASARAVSLLDDQTPRSAAMLVRSVDAEVRGQSPTAQEHLTELVDTFPDEPAWRMELAALLDRQGETEAAVNTYHDAIGLDPQFVRPHLELCRLYNSTRMNEASLARKHGELALARYRATADRLGEAQAMFCLADIQRVGDASERLQARTAAEAALALLGSIDAPYNLARSLHYAALVAGRDSIADAVGYWERSLVAAERVGNTALQASVLGNLGVSYDEVGDRGLAIEYYRRSGEVFEARGDHRGAAYNRANAAALMIRYGSNPAAGLRDVEGALAVVRKLTDRNFEVFCLQTIAAYHRNTGDRAAAERELNRALAQATELGLAERIVWITLERGLLREDAGDYDGARAALATVVDKATGARRTEARMALARVHLRLGDVETAAAVLKQAAGEVTDRNAPRLRPQLHVLLGHLAHETGRLDDAIAEFTRSAALWTDDLPDAASVEAAAYAAILRPGPTGAAVAALNRALKQAAAMGRVSLETRVRLHLAAIYLRQQRPDAAAAALAPAKGDLLDPELRAEVHHWRSRAAAARDDTATAERERQLARSAVEHMLQTMPAKYRSSFTRRAVVSQVLDPPRS